MRSATRTRGATKKASPPLPPLRLCVIAPLPASAKIEAEIAELVPEEQNEFLQGMGLQESALHVLARATYQLLGLETFFTAMPKESRAWTVTHGTTAVKAAGQIHTDMERGFICAEVFTLDDLEKHGSEASLRAAGKIRQEGKDYVIHDGDIVLFRFNV